jgi:hypothetical protein
VLPEWHTFFVPLMLRFDLTFSRGISCLSPAKAEKQFFSRAPAAHMILEQERKVYVGNTGHTISIRRQSAAVWVAAGEYMGERLETKGPTQGAAVRLWIRVARNTTSSNRHVAGVPFV